MITIKITADPQIDNAKEVVERQFKEWCDLAFKSPYTLEVIEEATEK